MMKMFMLPIILLLSACVDNREIFYNPENNRAAIKLEKKETYVIWGDDEVMPDRFQIEDLQKFIKAHARLHECKVYVDYFPRNSSHKTLEKQEQRANHLKHYIIREGNVLPSNATLRHGEVSDLRGWAEPVFKVATSCYRITPPVCNAGRQGYGEMEEHPNVNFGCANRANLANMVAFPYDLVRGRETDQSSALKYGSVAKAAVSNAGK